MTASQRDSLTLAGSLEVLPGGWLGVPGDAGPTDLVHASGMAIFDFKEAVILVVPDRSPLELASVGDALATASALLGPS